MKLNKILQKLTLQTLKECSDKELEIIRKMRNEKKIRKNMVNNKIILIPEHKKWVRQICQSNKNFFFVIKYNNNIIGGLGLKNYNNLINSGEWSFYISEKKNFIGLGATIEFMAINYFFDKFKLNKLFCFVLTHNLEVVNLHKKFGFKEISDNEYCKNNKLQIKKLDAVYLNLERNNWNKNYYTIKKKFF